MKKINEKIKKALSFLLILTMAMTSVGVSTFSAFADSEDGTGTTELNLDTDAENTASDDTVDLAFQTDGHGKFLINGEDKTNQTITVNKGTEVTYEVTADDGYQIQKIRTSYADGTETEVESKESDLTQNVVADQSLTLSAEFAEKQEEDTPATVTTPAPVVVTTPEDDKNTAKEDDTKTSADTTTFSSEENVKYNNRLSDVTADWGENEFLKEHLSASDLIESVFSQADPGKFPQVWMVLILLQPRKKEVLLLRIHQLTEIIILPQLSVAKQKSLLVQPIAIIHGIMNFVKTPNIILKLFPIGGRHRLIRPTGVIHVLLFRMMERKVICMQNIPMWDIMMVLRST